MKEGIADPERDASSVRSEAEKTPMAVLDALQVEVEQRALPEVGLRGCGLHAISRLECVDYILDELDAGRGGWVVTPNLDHLRRFLKDESFREMVEEADLRVADGTPIVWACALQRTPIPERVAGSDLITVLSEGAAKRGRSIFLLGGNEGTDTGAAEILKERYPGLRIAGTECPPMGFEQDPLYIGKLIKRLRDAKPDIVFVALGSPKQEAVIRMLRGDIPRAWWLGVGISFSFLCGEVPRAPRPMQRLGLEWLHRWMQEPARLTKRYLFQGIPFAATLLTRSALRGMIPKGRRASRYGRHKPSFLLLDDDVFALEHMQLLLSTHFNEVVFEKRTQPDYSGQFDFYFIDHDFAGERIGPEIVTRIREQNSDALIFGFSANLDADTLRRLINAGCDGVCDKTEPDRWKPVLLLVRKRLEQVAKRHYRETSFFGGVRHAAGSIQSLLHEWNSRTQGRAGKREEDS